MAGSSNKIFVGGLPQSCADDMFREYFQKYGEISDVVVMKDRETGNTRGFGFVTYEQTSSVDDVMAMYKDHQVGGKWVEVKRATPKGDMAGGGGGKGSGGGGKSMGGGGGGKGAGAGAGAGPDSRPGDWTCPGCGQNVFASKDSCFKCSTPKPQGGGGYAMPAAYGAPQGYGAPPGAYGAYGAPPGYAAYGAPPAYGAYGAPPAYGGAFAMPSAAYGAPPAAYAAYGAPPAAYGAYPAPTSAYGGKGAAPY